MPKTCSGCGGGNVIQAKACDGCGRAFAAATSRPWVQWAVGGGLLVAAGFGGDWACSRMGDDGGEMAAVSACIAALNDKGLGVDGTRTAAEAEGEGWRVVGLLDDGRPYVCTSSKVNGAWTVRAARVG